MASQKTINVVYNVDTKAIQVATQQVTAAKQATDQLATSAQRMSQQGAQGAQQFSNTIDGLKVQMAQLKAQIELTSQTDTRLLDQRISQYKEMQKQLDQYNSKLGDVDASTKQVGVSFSNLYNTVKAVVTAGILKEIVSTNLEMARLNGQIEAVKKAFGTLPNSTLLMEELKRSTHGTVDELTLMQNAIKFQNFKLPLQDLGKYLEFAAIRAQQTGESVEYMMNSIITGLGRGSIKILDNLQVSVSDMKKDMETLGITIQEAFGRQIDIEMTKMGGWLKTSKDDVDNLTRAWIEFKQAFSQIPLVSNTGAANWVTQKIEDWTMIFKAWKAVGLDPLAVNQYIQGLKQQQQATKDAAEQVKGFIDQNKGNTQALQFEIAITKQSILEKQRSGAILRNEFLTLANEANPANRERIDQIKQESVALSKSIEFDKAKVKLLQEYADSLKKVNSQTKTETTGISTSKAQPEDPELLGLNQFKEGSKIREAAFEEAKRGVVKFNNWLIQRDKFDTKLLIGQMREENKAKEAEEAAHQARMKRLIDFGAQQLFRTAHLIATEITQVEVQQLDDRINATREYYDNQINLAGNNTKAQERIKKQEDARLKKLDKERAEAQKRANIRKVWIDTAANVIRSILENGGIPYGLPFGAIALAMGIAQVAAINGFAEGVIDLKGPGTTKSDSIPAKLSKGESVMTAEETQSSMNILKSIRAKKLNDKVLDKLMIQVPQLNVKGDNSDVVAAIKESKPKQVDLVRQGSVIYEARESGKNMRRLVRSKSFNP